MKRIDQAAELISQGNPKQSKEAALDQCVFATFCDLASPDVVRRICISPQCGFASHSEGNVVGEEDVKKKLGLVVSIAKEMWADA